MCSKKHHPSFTPILPDPIMFEMIFPTPKEKPSRFLSELRFFNLKILYLVTEFVMDFRSRSLEKLYGEAIHPFMKSKWWRPFFWLSSCVLVEFIRSKFCLQIVRPSKIPKGFLKHHMFGRFGLGPFLFFVDHGNSCGFLQMTWAFLQQLCRLCTQQNTKGTEWESPSCRPVSHNSTRTSGRMQKSSGCFCLEKMKPERLRKKKGGETKKAMNSMCFCS